MANPSAVKFGDFFGLKELDKALKELPRETRKRVGVDALRHAAKPVLDEASATAAFVDRTGNLRRSMRGDRGTWALRRIRYGTVQIGIGPNPRIAPHAHLVEMGTKPHRIDAKKGSFLFLFNSVFMRDVHHPGTRPRPFFRPAWERNASKVMDGLRDSVWKALREAAAKLASNAERGKLSSKVASQL